MIPKADKIFHEWAAWVRRPDGALVSGWGKSVLARVMEGKGEILPGAPYPCVNRGVSEHDRAMLKVESFLAKLNKREKRLIKTFYLTNWPVDDKAKYLKLDKRTMYFHLHRVHLKYLETSFTHCTTSGKL